MSIFDKKFRDLLDHAPEHVALKERVTTLEAQVAALGNALTTVMKAYSDMARVTVDHRKSLEEIYSFLTDPLEYETSVASEGETAAKSDMTPEELAAYKRNLN